MPHAAIANVASAVAVQPGAVVSKVIHRDQELNVAVFGFDSGEGLTEHRASQGALVQVLVGRLDFVADGEEFDAGPGSGGTSVRSGPTGLDAGRIHATESEPA